MNVLERQTLHRICQFPDLLPQSIAKLWGTNKESDATAYATSRVMKLNNGKAYAKRFDELVELVKDREILLVNIFDEAHYSATSKDRSGELVESNNMVKAKLNLSLQIILFQKLLFWHQLTQYMMT